MAATVSSTVLRSALRPYQTKPHAGPPSFLILSPSTALTGEKGMKKSMGKFVNQFPHSLVIDTPTSVDSMDVYMQG